MIGHMTDKNLWTASATNRPDTTPLAANIATDVAIIGGGFTGLSAALHLAEAGVDVALLEGREIGHGGSGRNVGLVNAGMWLRPDDVVSTLGATIGNRLLRELGEGPALIYRLVEKHTMDCEAVRAGTLHMAVGQKGALEIAIRAAQWQKRGSPVELLNADAAKRLTGAEGFTGALLDRRAGTIQPLAYAHGLAGAAMKSGAKLFTDSPVISASRIGTDWRLITKRGEVRAKKIIMAGNDYATPIAGVGWHGHVARLTLLPYFQFATKPLSPALLARILPEEHGAWDTGLVMNSFRRDKAGRLIFGSIGSLSAMAAGTHRAFALRSLKAMFPYLGKIEFDHWWDGKIGMTANNLPSFHQPDDTVWSITGYNGRGISPGTVFGRALAGVAMGNMDAMPLPLEPITPDPMRSVKSLFYHVGSQAKHWLDRRI